MSILSALKAQEGSIKELALLPQQQLLKMAQMGQLSISMVPIILNEKAQMAQQAANMQAMGQQMPPTVIEQAMAVNAQSEAPAAGIEALPIREDMYNEQSMAAGGIVAFANGGMSDEDEEEDDDSFDSQMDKENDELLTRLMQARRSRDGSAGLGALGSGLRPTMSLAEAQQTAAAPAGEARGSGLRMAANHKYAKDIVAQAENMGLDPDFALKLAMKETGGLRNPETAKSSAGALGVMQLMPGTARDMGVKDPMDPQQNISGGLRYAKLMLEKYGDPKIAAIAYNWGPGNTDKWLRAGADMSKLPKETQNYVANLKEGGEIRFQNRGLVPSDDYEGLFPFLGRAIDDSELARLLRFAGKSAMDSEVFRYGKPLLFGGAPVPTTKEEAQAALDTLKQEAKRPTPKAPAKTAAQKAEEDKYAGQYEAQDIQEGDLGRLVTPASAAMQQTAEGAEGAAAPSVRDRLEELLSKREAGLAAQRQQDKYMALLSAGLGMMSGSSPYALQNIGAGALQGVASMQAAAKQRAAEENAILSGRVGQARLAQNEALRREMSSEAQEARMTRDLGIARQNMLKNVIAAKKLDITSLDQNQLAKLEEEADAMLARDPAFQAMYKKLYGSQFAPARAARGPVDYAKLFPGHKPPSAK